MMGGGKGIQGRERPNNPTLLTHSAQAISPNTPIQGRSVHERKNNEIIDKGKKDKGNRLDKRAEALLTA